MYLVDFVEFDRCLFIFVDFRVSGLVFLVSGLEPAKSQRVLVNNCQVSPSADMRTGKGLLLTEFCFPFSGGLLLPDPPFKSAWRPPRLIEHIPSDTQRIVGAFEIQLIRYNKNMI